MPRINVYIPNPEDFAELKAEVKFLWYKKFGESLATGAIIVKALIFLRDHLKNTTEESPKTTLFGWLRK